MFTALDTNLWRAYHNQLPFKMTITTYSYATNDLLPPFGRIYISPPNLQISQCTNYKKKGNAQALLSISLKAIASLLAVWYASNCGEQRGKKDFETTKKTVAHPFLAVCIFSMPT